jgi:Mg-chelatase subunit ChlD
MMAVMKAIALLIPFLAGCGVSGVGQFRAGGSTMAATPAQPLPPRATAAAEVSVEINFFGVPLRGSEDVVFVLDRSGSMGLPTLGAAGGSVRQAGKAAGMKGWQSALAGVGTAVVAKKTGADQSAGASKLEVAKMELLGVLDQMPDGTRVSVIFFDEGIHSLSPQLIFLNSQTRHRIRQFVTSTEPGGSTAAVPAMRLAYEMGARRIVFLSDGLANSGGGPEKLRADARQAAMRGVRVDTVGLGLGQTDEILADMAAAGGGINVMR